MLVLELVFSLDFAWVKRLLTNQRIEWLLFWNVDFGSVVSLFVWTNQVCAVTLDFELGASQVGQTDGQTDNGFYISRTRIRDPCGFCFGR